MSSISTQKARTRVVHDPALPRNIAIFIDGTWNQASTQGPTNVRKLFLASQAGVDAGRDQFQFYISGVGTTPKFEDGDGSLSDADYRAQLARYLLPETPGVSTPDSLKLMGGLTGWGTEGRIKTTYHQLCSTYRHKRDDKDRVFLFGFSRGAFAARSLAGFVGKVGLLLEEELEHVERAYELYERGETAAQSELADFLEKLTGVRVVTADSDYYLPVHFLGVWDTVASLGLPSRLEWLTAPFTEYHQVDVPPSVATARHALALHELRGSFEPLPWGTGSHGDIKQVWFTGAHADVGGGYAAGEDGLSDIPLRWMANEAMDAGLAVDSKAKWWNSATENAVLHHEFKGLFLATWPTPRSWLRSATDESMKSHHFHRSTVNYLKEADRVRYRFNLPYVNSGLSTIDELAFPLATLSQLLGQEIVG